MNEILTNNNTNISPDLSIIKKTGIFIVFNFIYPP